jgi:hypothetical protein
MPIIENADGSYSTLSSDGAWVPAKMAENPQTGVKHVLDGDKWTVLPSSKPSVLGSMVRGIERGAFAESNDEAKGLQTGLGSMLSGEGYSAGYERGRDKSRAQDNLDDETNPIATGAGQVIGAVGGAMAAAPLAAATGLTRLAGVAAPYVARAAAPVIAPIAAQLNPLLARLPQWVNTTAKVSGGGAVSGGVGGFNEGEGGFGARLQNGAEGLALGAVAAPVIAGGANAAVGTARRALNATGLRDPDAVAERLLLRAVERDAPQGRPVATEIDRMGAQLDPAVGTTGPALPTRPNELILPDVGGENMTNLAAVASNTPGQAKTMAATAVNARRGASPERIAGAVDDGLGGGGGTRVADEVGALREERSTGAAPLYERAFQRRVPQTVQDRIDPLVSSNEGQNALGHAVTILEREGRAAHLRSGDPADLFDPAAMGLVRAEDGGWMLQGRMENMRLVDAVKRGMDDMLEQYRDPVTRRLPNTEAVRALDGQRAAYVAYLRGHPHLQPYARALDAWAGPSRSLDAVDQGRQSLKLDRDVVAGIVQRMQPADMDFFRIGFGRAITDAASDPRNAPEVARKLLEDRQMQERLRHAIPDPAQRAQFAAAMEQEVLMKRTSDAVNPRAGSPTGRLATGGADMEIDPPSGLVQGGLAAVERGSLFGATARGLRALHTRGEGHNPATSTALANRLFSMDPAQQAATIAQLRNRLMLDQLGAVRGRAIARPVLRGLGTAAGMQAE